MSLDLNRGPLVMGILNVTPDSFSDGGRFQRLDDALRQVDRMVNDGADLLDIGGESTRPGAEAVSQEAEISRTIPVIEAIASRFDIPISIDTSKPAVMQAAADAGVSMINDVNALREPGAVELAARLNIPVCLMHMQGRPRSMQQNPAYQDVVMEIRDFLLQRADACVQAGIPQQQILLDPGFGFGKALEHNLALLKHLGAFVDTGFPVLVGLSRKSMLGQLTGRDVQERLAGSLAVGMLALEEGAGILRVHDVAETVDILKIWKAVRVGGPENRGE